MRKQRIVLEQIRHIAFARRHVDAAVTVVQAAAGQFDAVADMDLQLRDPAQPDRLLPAYDSGDHLHPNDRGYRAMAAATPALPL